MVRDLGVEDKEAPFYAGLLVSAYAVAEALTSMGWGALSDRVGRKPVVLFGLVGVATSSLIFGLAKTYWVALLARFIGGALNGESHNLLRNATQHDAAKDCNVHSVQPNPKPQDLFQ